MSKEKIEVGDIWKHDQNRTLIYITEVGSNYFDFIGKKKDGEDSMFFSNCRFDEYAKIESLQKNHTYIGKSKINIEDLFEVKEENNAG